jgi:hypothetical protein
MTIYDDKLKTLSKKREGAKACLGLSEAELQSLIQLLLIIENWLILQL